MSVYAVIKAGHYGHVVSRRSRAFGNVGDPQGRIYCHTCQVVLGVTAQCAGIKVSGLQCRQIVRPDLGQHYCPHHVDQEATSGPA